MALIKCPECGQEVSDRAAACPRCAFPLSELRTDGTVKIKLYQRREQLNLEPAMYDALGKVPTKITDKNNNNILWSGMRFENAIFNIESPTDIIIVYGDKTACEAHVEAGKKYALIEKKKGFFGLTFHLIEVDVIDTD